MADQGETPVLVQRRAGLLALVLNRPQVLNTLNLEMIRLLRRALDEALADDRVRLVLLEGAGEKGFCAGGDLKELARAVREGDPARDHRFFPDGGPTGWLFLKCPPGYPEYLALTGYELAGPECVRLGLATHLVPAARWPELRRALEAWSAGLSRNRAAAAAQLRARLAAFAAPEVPPRKSTRLNS